MASANSSVVNPTKVERKSDLEFVVTRTFDGPVHLVFEAWSNPDLFKRWWVPEGAGLTLLSCEMDVRTGGKYRLVFAHPAAPDGMAFFGTYREVVPGQRMVWTNEESGDQGGVTTVTFEERDASRGRRQLIPGRSVEPEHRVVARPLRLAQRGRRVRGPRRFPERGDVLVAAEHAEALERERQPFRAQRRRGVGDVEMQVRPVGRAAEADLP